MTDTAIRPTEDRSLATGDAGTPAALEGARRPGRSGGTYSRFANAMRIALPVIAIAIMVIVVAWPQLVEQPRRFSLGVSKVTVNDAGGQQIVNARFTGTDRDDQPFTITADTAFQPVGTPGLVDLAFPKADLAQKSGAWIALSAESGLYDKKSQQLDLKGGVYLFHDTGYELRTSTARVDLGKGVASGNDAVSGHGPFGTLKSSGFQILDRGKRLIFTGKSTLVLYPTGKDGKG